jgi:hypothetical protein
MEEHTPPSPPDPPTSGRSQAPQELVFYYSRARRLERASPAVRALNEASPQRRPGIFKTLTATKPLAFLFISVVLAVVVFSLSAFLGRDKTPALGGNTLSVSALRFEGSTYIVLKKSAAPAAYTGVVDMAISAAGKTGAGISPPAKRSVFFSTEPEEEFRLAVPFEAPELLLLLRVGTEYGNFKVKAD